jgi:predicted tellurium resistance membrane protein TerC
MELIIALVALTTMEIVLGIDNIVFISIISGRLPPGQQRLARRVGLMLALVMRLLLLATLSYVVNELNKTAVFELTSLGIPQQLLERLGSLDAHAPSPERLAEINGVTWRDIILFVGGLFLLWKSVREIHEQFAHDEPTKRKGYARFATVLIQIALLDIVFSLDSVITAVGMVQTLWVMAVAIIAAVIVMLVFAESVSRFVSQNPTVKMLALSFLILIGVVLIADATGAHIDKGYIYFAMAFSVIVEGLNIALRRRNAAKKGEAKIQNATSIGDAKS